MQTSEAWRCGVMCSCAKSVLSINITHVHSIRSDSSSGPDSEPTSQASIKPDASTYCSVVLVYPLPINKHHVQCNQDHHMIIA